SMKPISPAGSDTAAATANANTAMTRVMLDPRRVKCTPKGCQIRASFAPRTGTESVQVLHPEGVPDPSTGSRGFASAPCVNGRSIIQRTPKGCQRLWHPEGVPEALAPLRGANSLAPCTV